MTETKLRERKERLASEIIRRERLIKKTQEELATLTAETIEVNNELLRIRGSKR